MWLFSPCAWTNNKTPTHGIGARTLQLGALLKIAHAIEQEFEKEDRPSIEVHLRSNIKGGPGTMQASKQASRRGSRRKAAGAREKEVRRLKHSKVAAFKTTYHHEHGSPAHIRLHQNIPPRSRMGPAGSSIEIRSVLAQFPINRTCQ